MPHRNLPADEGAAVPQHEGDKPVYPSSSPETLVIQDAGGSFSQVAPLGDGGEPLAAIPDQPAPTSAYHGIKPKPPIAPASSSVAYGDGMEPPQRGR